jgi:cyclopropane fatty-acyl-phospholipid synthase-like methyltransferase
VTVSCMDDDLAVARRARMRWNTPLSTVHADLLLDRLRVDSVAGIVDVGCGWGELLLRAVERAVGSAPAAGEGDSVVRGVGVDTDPVALERGRALARRRGLEERVQFVLAEAASWSGAAGRALCVGSSHAFGGSRAALEALATLVPRGGRLLFGDGCWPGLTTPAAVDVFGDQVLPLPELVDVCRAAGWRVIHLSVADQREWDDFESTSRAGWQEWLLANESDLRAGEVREWLDTREHQYIHDYRGVLGFAYLVLAR